MDRRGLLPKLLASTVIVAVFICFGDVLALTKNDSETHRVAMGAVKDELWEIAAREFRTLLHDRPNSEYAASATYYLGFCLFRVEDFEGAAEALSSYLSRWPRGEFAVFAKYYLGRSLLEGGQPKRAEPLLQDVLSSKGKLVNGAMFWLGRTFFEMAQWAKASEAFLEVIKSGDKEYEDSARYELGRTYSKGGRYAESIEVARALLQRPIEVGFRLRARLLVATNLANLEMFDEAVREAQAIASSSSSISTIHGKAIAITGEAYRMSGRPEMAIGSFRRYLKEAPGSDGAAWAAQSIIECLASMSKCREAHESMLLWESKFPEETVCELASRIAGCYSASGAHSSAVEVLRYAMNRATSDSLRLSTALKLADSHFRHGDFREVILLLSPLLARGLLTQDSDIAGAALLMVGASHEQVGSLDEAERGYRLLLSLEADAMRTEIAGRRLVDVLIAKGDFEGAWAALNKLSSSSTIDERFVNLAATVIDAFARSGADRRAIQLAREILRRLVGNAALSESAAPALHVAFLTALSGYHLCDIILELAQKTDPELKDAEKAGLLFAAGECRFISGENASASTIYQEVIREFPGWANTHVVLSRLGTIAFAEGRFEVAAQRFAAARVKAPPGKGCDLLYMVAESLFRDAKLVEALSKFEEIVKREDCRGQVVQNSYLKGGMVCEELGRFEQARAAFLACASMSFDETARSVAESRLARLGD